MNNIEEHSEFIFDSISDSRTQCNWRCETSVVFERSVNINTASETIDVNIEDDLGLSVEFDEHIAIEVEFTETVTKKIAKANANVVIVKYAYSLIFTGEPNFAPNSLYSFKISLRRFDGTSVRCVRSLIVNRFNSFSQAPAGVTVAVTITQYKQCYYTSKPASWVCPNNEVKQERQTDSTGTVSMSIATENYNYMNIVVWPGKL